MPLQLVATTLEEPTSLREGLRFKKHPGSSQKDQVTNITVIELLEIMSMIAQKTRRRSHLPALILPLLFTDGGDVSFAEDSLLVAATPVSAWSYGSAVVCQPNSNLYF